MGIKASPAFNLYVFGGLPVSFRSLAVSRCSLIYKLFLFVALIGVLLQSYSRLVLAQTPSKTNRKIVQRVEPEYPDFFRNGHFEGRIVAEATVLASGNVSNVEIKAGNPMFAAFASKALMKWKYAPGPDKTVEEVIFNFNSTQR